MTDKYAGLSSAQVDESRRLHGANVLRAPRRKPWWRDFLDKFADPLILILLVAGALSVGIAFYEYYGLGAGWKVFFEPIGIFVAIFLATGLAFLFEQRANKAFALLNRVNDDEPVEVMRDGFVTTVPRRDVVTGDLVYLTTGCEVPADGRLVDAVSLSVDESSLTGEPMCHKTIVEADFDADATYPSNRVLRGTKVMEGHGAMVVEQVGDATEMGKVFEQAQLDSTVKTPLNEQLDSLAHVIANASYICAALIIVGRVVHFLGWGNWQSWLTVLPVAAFFAIVVYKFRNWGKAACIVAIITAFAVFIATVMGVYAMLGAQSGATEWAALLSYTLQTLMVAVTLIVVSVPEGLPMAVTLSLAFSMSRMLRTNNLVRKMHACETMGATTVICTDKTGTLTQNRMQVAHAEFFGNPSDTVIEEAIAANSTAQIDISEADSPRIIGNPTEGALLLWLRERGVDYNEVRRRVTAVDEIPFSTERKYMATIVRTVDGREILYVKGAPEIVYAMCSERFGVTPEMFDARLRDYQNRAMRTLALAYRVLADGQHPVEHGALCDARLTLIGVVAISDPVRTDVPAAVGEVTGAGIKVKIVTGDTPATAREIGRRIGLWHDSEDTERNIITGVEFAALTDEELRSRAPELKIIARARPMDKKRLVEALQACGEVVAVTGDGTNDAPALKAAQVGLSMGDGTSVAKEASDITIIDNSFSSIGRAVMWGRSLYKNIQRFLLFQLTVNVAACLLVVCGAFIGTESPLTVTQMLWVNLIMDTFGAMALASLPPTAAVMHDKPRNRFASILTRPMLGELMAVGVLFFAITFGFYWLFNHAEVTSLPQMLHAGIGSYSPMSAYEATLLFSIFVWTHFWYMFDARCFDTRKSLFSVRMSRGFWSIVWVIVAGQLLITEVGYEFFNVEPMLHSADWSFNPSGALDLLLIVTLSSSVVWVREGWRLLRKQSL